MKENYNHENRHKYYLKCHPISDRLKAAIKQAKVDEANRRVLDFVFMGE